MWKFNKKQIDDFIQYRQSQMPDGYTVNDEMRMISYYCCMFLPALYKHDPNQCVYVSYAAVLFKRYYMNKSIFEQQNLHQILLITNYLGIKLYGLSHNQIAIFAQDLKKKAKHERFFHFGDEQYAKYEMMIVQSLGYDIDLKPIYPIILSINQVLNIKELFDKAHYPVYDRRVKEYFLQALQGFTIFLYKDSQIAFAIVECALQISSQEVLIPNTQQQQKLRRLCHEHKTSGKMFIAQLEINELEMRKHYDQIQEIVKHLLELKENLKDYDKDYEKFRQIKQKLFTQPTNVEFAEIKKQVYHN